LLPAAAAASVDEKPVSSWVSDGQLRGQSDTPLIEVCAGPLRVTGTGHCVSPSMQSSRSKQFQIKQPGQSNT